MAEAERLLFQFLGDEDDLINALRRTEQQLKKATKGKYRFNVEGSGFERANQEIDTLERHLRTLSEQEANPEVHAVIRDAIRDLGIVRGALAALPENKTVTVQVKNKGLATLSRAIIASDRLGDSFQKLNILSRGGSLTPDPSSWDAFAGALSRTALQIRRLPSFIGGLSIALISSLAPAILAVTAAMAGMVAGVGALSAALIGSLIPAVGVAASLFNRLSKVMEARKSLESARASDAASAASAVGTEAAAESRLETAARAVADAQRAQQRASADLQAATEALADAAEDAFREMEDAAEAASDALLSLADARLGLDEAQLGVDEAKLALEEFREEIGLTGDSFGEMFKKFTDVDAQFDSGALRSILAAGDTSKADQLELESLILRVRRAKLQERQATDGVSDAERELQRARERNNEFLREGIAASDSYQAALSRVEAAEEAVADATRGVQQARESAADSAAEVATSTAKMSSALAAARAEFKKLSPEEKAFLRAMERIDGVVERLKKRIAAPIFAAFTDGLNALPGILAKVEGPLSRLADAWADLARVFASNIAKEVTDNFAFLTDGAIELSIAFTEIFSSLFTLIMNLAKAAMPELLRMVNDISDAFSGWASGSENVKGLRDALNPAFKLIRLTVGIVGDLVDALFAAFVGGAEPITKFFKFIKKATEGISDFFKSTEGQEEVKGFFEDTLPFVQELLKFLGKLVKIFIRLLRIILPVAKPILEMFNLIADVVLFLLKIIDDIISPFKSLIGEVLGFFLIAGALGKVVKLAGLAVTNFGAILGRVGGFIKGLFKPFIEVFTKVIGWIKTSPNKFAAALRPVVNVFERLFKRVGNFLITPVRTGLEWIRGALGDAVGWVGRLASSIVRGFRRGWDGLRAVVTWVLDRFRNLRDLGISIFEKLGTGIAAAFRGVKTVIKAILNGLITVANKFIKAWNAVFGKERKISGPLGIGDIKLPSLRLGEIPKLALGGIVGQDTLFRAGEGSGSEAVIPLSRSVLRRLGQAIVSAMGTNQIVSKGATQTRMFGGRALLATASTGHPQTIIQRQDVHLPAPPGGGLLDPRYAAVQFARELKRRGF